MDLPIVFPQITGQRYDCEQCGRGCRELVVFLTERDRKKIDQQKWQGRLALPPYIRFGRGYVLNQTPKRECVFLREDGRCAIHAEFGYTEKPLSCQLYPFVLLPEEDCLRVTVRFDCPAIAKGAGRPLPEHRADVVRIASAFRRAAPLEMTAGPSRLQLTADREMSGVELNRLVEHLDRWMADVGRPVTHRLVGLNDLVNTLAAARLGGMEGERFDELLGMLIADLPNVVASFDRQAVPPPSRKQLKLLRQAVFAHCENIQLAEARSGLIKRWSYRMDQLKRARRLAAGVGDIPRLVRGYSGATFEALDQVQPDRAMTANDGDSLLTRYLRTRILGRTVVGPGYHGWPLLDGLHSLLLAVAVVGWLGRYFAANDRRATMTYNDVVAAVQVVDRNATRSPELGQTSARLRLRYLSEDQGILRLLCAYPV